jgi:hypothetical protein
MNSEFPDDDIPPNMLQSFVESSQPTARVYDVVMELNAPAPVNDIADLALCSIEEAEDALEVLVDFNIARISTAVDSAIEYEPNRGYFLWRHAHNLAGEHTVLELDEIDAQIDEAIAQLTETYGVDQPEGIPLEVEDSVVREERQEAVTLWETLVETRDTVALARTLQSVYTRRGVW